MTEHHLTLLFDDFEARLVLGGEHSLYDLAEFLIRTLGFDFDHAFEFCANLRNPYRSKEKYTLFADLGQGDDPGVKKTKVSAVFRPRRKMVFRFDYGDDWMFLVHCTAVKESAAKRKFKKVIEIKGTPPVQYPDNDEEGEWMSDSQLRNSSAAGPAESDPIQPDRTK